MSRSLLALLVGFCLLAGVYSVTTPAFETPDEIWHFAFIYHLRTERALPVSEPHTQSLWRQQGVQAPGYYLAAALLTAWVDVRDFPAVYARANPHAAIGRPDAAANRNYLIHHFDEEGFPWRGTFLALHLVRFFSVALAGVTLWAVHGTLVRLLAPRWALLATAGLAATPQFLFVSGAASNDNAINATATLVLWQVTRLLTGPREQWHHPRPWLLLGVFLGLALLAKLSGLALVGVVGLAGLWMAWRARSPRLLVRGALWTGVPAVLLAGWWYVRNFLLYRDPLAWNIWQQNILLRVIPADWRTIWSELESLERSYWGLFGWFNVPYPEWVYGLFRAVELMVLAGLVLALVRWARMGTRRGRIEAEQIGAAGLLLIWLLALTVSWVRFMRIAPAAQGRYFFPAASGLLLLWAWSWWGLGPRVGRVVAGVSVGGLAVLALVTPFWILRPAYTPPPMSPATDTPLLAAFGREMPQIGLVTVGAIPSRLHPGSQITLEVTWRALAPVARDYSVFVHLVDEVGIPVAQVDTLPGGGLWATSRWLPGTELRDRYVLALPETVYTPNQVDWQVGLYHAPTGERLPRLEPSGLPADAGATVGRAAIEPREAGSVPNPVQVDFADNVRLVGYRFSHRVLAPGQPVTVTLYWQARGPVGQDYTTFAHLLAEDLASMYGGHDGVPTPPTTAWHPGQVVVDVHPFVVPADTPPGFYRFEVGLYTRPDFRRLAVLDAEGAEGADRLILGPVKVR